MGFEDGLPSASLSSLICSTQFQEQTFCDSIHILKLSSSLTSAQLGCEVQQASSFALRFQKCSLNGGAWLIPRCLEQVA